MGDPGTKVVLTLLTRLVEFAARPKILSEQNLKILDLQQLERYPFQTAGDDQLHVGSFSLFQRMRDRAPLFGLEISEDKFGCFKHGTNFCE